MPLVMKYHLKSPVLNADIVEQELWKAHRYRIALTQIHCKARDMIRAVEDEYGIRELYGQIKDLGIEKAKLNKGEGGKGKDVKKRVNDITEKISSLYAEIDRLRSNPEMKARLYLIDNDKRVEKSKKKKRSLKEARADKTPNNSIKNKMWKAARAENDLFWGTGAMVDKAVAQSFKKVPLYDGREDKNPDFPRWTGEGTLAIQIQSGEGKSKIQDIFGDDHRVRIDPVDMKLLTSPKRSDRRRAAKTMLTMAVSGTSRGNSEYIMAKWPMVMHRPLVSSSQNITWVYVTKTKKGPGTVWSCEVTVNTEPRGEDEDVPSGGTLAVVLGWRVVEGNRVRVAHWLADTGDTGVFDLSRHRIVDKAMPGRDYRGDSPYKGIETDGGRSGIFATFRRSEEIVGTRADNFNAAIDELVAWLKSIDTMPIWMRAITSREEGTAGPSGKKLPSRKQATAYIDKWKSPRHLVRLIAKWSENRFDGDEEIFEHMLAWRKQNHHLYQFEAGIRVKAQRRRNNAYRNLASRLAKTYSRIIIDSTNFKSIREKEADKAKEDEQRLHKTHKRRARSNLQIVAPGILRSYINEATKKSGSSYEEVASDGTTFHCPRCNTSHKANKDIVSHMFSCSHCGLTRDISHVRLLNMLRSDGRDVSEIIQQQEAILNGIKAAE
ncbi:MAG: hypothetical protein WC565_03815 [Parcubacteria group bacterium]